MRVRFWGTRGSIAKPGPSTLRYGGNTSCVEVLAGETRIVLDCGTGAHELGRALQAEGAAARGHLLIGHTHWDHIQGFPFFEPLFTSEAEWDVYAPGGRSQHIEASLSAQMSYDYHPVTVDSLAARVRFHDLVEGSFEVGPVRVTTRYLHHPALTLGYRLEHEGVSLVYASDHEPHSIHPRRAAPGTVPIHYEDQRHLEFLAEADLVIHDAQYLLSEFPEKSGWGHTPVERAVDYAIAASVRKLVLYHHDPERDDDAMDALLEAARERAARGHHVPEVVAAAERDEIELAPRSEPAAMLFDPSRPALMNKEPPTAATVLIVEDDRPTAAALARALEPEGMRLVRACDGRSGLELARKQPPTLMLLDMHLPELGGLDVCRRLRADRDARLRELPVLILTGSALTEEALLEAFVAGATDFLTKPIKPTLLRSRVRGWLLRSRARGH